MARAARRSPWPPVPAPGTAKAVPGVVVSGRRWGTAGYRSQTSGSHSAMAGKAMISAAATRLHAR
jgi:hypothetical protein